MNVLEIDNVELYFGKKEILKGVYFKAEKGIVTGILGSNGCGKTSFLRILFGELKPRNKLIRIDDKPLQKSLYSYGKINYLSQFQFIPDNLSLQRIFQLYGLEIQEFKDIFPSFILNPKSKFGILSGGEKRLIELYVTLHSNAEIILLDEPFSYLAPVYNEIIKKEINNIKKEKCIIITDHRYEEILEISDELYLIKEGYTKKIESKKDLVSNNYIRSL